MEIDRDFSPGGAASELLENVRKRIECGESRPFADGPHRS
jgi:hypothetical protein